MFGPPPFMSVRSSFYSMIPHNGLDFCLDAGDINSYDGTSQTWVDLSGNGNSFFRGVTSGSEASDPTFNGTAGKRTSAEFFGFDGGDLFRETTGHTFAEPWHKAGGVATLAGVATKVAAGNLIPFANSGGLSPGVILQLSNSGANNAIQLIVVGELSQVGIFGTGIFNEPIFFATAWDASVGAGGITFQINAARTTGNSTYGAPIGTAGSSIPYQIGAANAIMSPNGSEVYCMAAWSRRLSNTELDTIYEKLKKRFTTFP